MMNFLESSTGRIASLVQSIGANFDPEVLSLPGGSVIAVALWAYGTAAGSFRRATFRRETAADDSNADPKPPRKCRWTDGWKKPLVPCASCCGRL